MNTKPSILSQPVEPIHLQVDNKINLTIPLHISISLGSPTQATSRPIEIDSARPSVAENLQRDVFGAESVISQSVVQAYEKFDWASFASSEFSWKAVLSAGVLSHLAYETHQVIVATSHERFELEACEFLATDATECFVVADRDTVAVAFRGTADLRDWLGNLNAFSTRASYGSLHRGFYFAFQAVKSSLENIIHSMGLNNRKLLLTGHSLGGALATVAAAEWSSVFDIRSVYTFGQPRVCKSDSANHIEQNVGSAFFRIVNDDDIVTRVPPGYQHVGKMFRFGPTGIVSNESLAGSLVASEEQPLTENQFAALQASLRNPLVVEPLENVGLEGFLPSFSDNSLSNYFTKILKQDD